MICHVCEQPASGQCEKCRRFYCPLHGSVRCIRCQETDERIRTEAAPGAQPVAREPNPFRLAVTCFACSNAPTTTCSNCGQFYCKEHRAEESLYVPEEWCTECAVGMKTYSIVMIVFVYLLVLYVLIDAFW
jgi:hypothetical protein